MKKIAVIIFLIATLALVTSCVDVTSRVLVQRPVPMDSTAIYLPQDNDYRFLDYSILEDDGEGCLVMELVFEKKTN